MIRSGKAGKFAIYYRNVQAMTAGVPEFVLAVGSGLAAGQNATTANNGRKPAVNVAVDVFEPQGKP